MFFLGIWKGMFILIGIRLFSQLLPLFSTNTTLSKLSLSYNPLGDVGVTSLAHALSYAVQVHCIMFIHIIYVLSYPLFCRKNRILKELSLIEISVGDDGASSIAELISYVVLTCFF